MITEEYLEIVDFNKLDPNKYEIIDIIQTDKKRFYDMENETKDLK